MCVQNVKVCVCFVRTVAKTITRMDGKLVIGQVEQLVARWDAKVWIITLCVQIVALLFVVKTNDADFVVVNVLANGLLGIEHLLVMSKNTKLVHL